MATRVTMKMLEAKIKSLNDWAGFPDGAWTNENGRFKANIGAYVLDAAYGGYRLCQITSDGGGERDLTPRANASTALDLISVYWQGMLAGMAKSAKI